MESHVIGKDRSRFPWRRTVGEVRRGERRISCRMKERVAYMDLGLNLGEREEQVACHASALALAKTDEACREAKM